MTGATSKCICGVQPPEKWLNQNLFATFYSFNTFRSGVDGGFLSYLSLQAKTYLSFVVSKLHSGTSFPWYGDHGGFETLRTSGFYNASLRWRLPLARDELHCQEEWHVAFPQHGFPQVWEKMNRWNPHEHWPTSHHRNPEHWSHPDTYNPEQWTPEERAKRCARTEKMLLKSAPPPFLCKCRGYCLTNRKIAL